MSKLLLSLFLGGPGHHVAAWRHPNSRVGSDFNMAYCSEIARAAERADYDLFFLADLLYVRPGNGPDAGRRYPTPFLDPVVLLSAIAAQTDRIGLGCTISTTYSAPFNTARSFAALDSISGGRAAWNVVTSMVDMEAANFGLDVHHNHGERYERAEEYLHVVRKLWDSWEDDAFVVDKARGIAIEPTSIHQIDHHGKFFDVAGPLNISRPPQGHPVIIQAGGSESGQALAARSADIVFTAQNNLTDAQKFYAGIKRQIADAGRNPDDVVVMPGIVPIVGRTDAEAKARAAELRALIDPAVALAQLAHVLGERDISKLDLDKPLPLLDDSNASQSRVALISEISKKGELSVRELAMEISSSRGHFYVVGSGERVADLMTDWIDGAAADGFNIMPSTIDFGFTAFNDFVLPVLRARGYLGDGQGGKGQSLRQRLGLSRPASVYARQ